MKSLKTNEPFNLTSQARILLINKDPLVQKSLYELLSRSGHKVDLVNSLAEAIPTLYENTYPIILADINGSSSVSFIKTIKQKSPISEIIVLASYGNLETAVSSIKLGAFNYLVKPVDDKEILCTIEEALSNKTFEKTRVLPARIIPKKENTFHGLVGNSGKLEEIFSVIERIASSKATILLLGESGTGKRMIAHAIHTADAKRKHKPFVEVSCGALPRDLIESELFGHTRGAFTGAISDRKGRFELAHGGTLLLDDIDALSLDLQTKLLRIIQQKEFERVGDHKTIKVDVRIIASTNQDIKKAVAEKRFREDLYYRINVISMLIPPLRERKEDLPSLVNHFVNLYSKENHKKTKGVSHDALRALIGYDWPGNIRELENIIERAIILDTDSTISKDDLPEVIFIENISMKTEPGTNILKNFVATLKDALQEPEKIHILRVLKEVGWNKKEAAKKLGVNRTTLYNKLRKYDLLLNK